jgi:hypothetical protein
MLVSVGLDSRLFASTAMGHVSYISLSSLDRIVSVGKTRSRHVYPPLYCKTAKGVSLVESPVSIGQSISVWATDRACAGVLAAPPHTLNGYSLPASKPRI